MKKLAWGLTLLAIVGTALGGPINPKDIAPPAKWVAHLDVQGLVASQFGQYVLNQLREREQLDAKLGQFVAVFGFDPLKDLASITLYGAEYKPASVVVIVKGKCDKERLLGLLRQNPSYSESAYGSHTIHQWMQNPEDAQDDGIRRGAFYNDTTVVVCRSEALAQAAIDVLDGKTAGTTNVIPATAPGTFLVAAAKDLALPEQTDPNAQIILKRISGGVLMAGETGDTAALSAKLSIRKAQDAQRLQQILNGGLAFLSIVAELTAEKEGQIPFWAPLIEGAQATGSGDAVELKIAVKTQTLIRIAEEGRKADEAKKAQGTK